MGNVNPSMRVLKSTKKKIENGSELIATFEVVRGGGARYVFDALSRTTETDKCIGVLTTLVVRKFAARQDNVPSETEVLTTLMDSEKGEVEGDHRWDTVRYTFVSRDGIRQPPVRRLKHSVAKRRKGLSERDALDRVAEFLKPKRFD